MRSQPASGQLLIIGRERQPRQRAVAVQMQPIQIAQLCRSLYIAESFNVMDAYLSGRVIRQAGGWLGTTANLRVVGKRLGRC